MSNSSLSLDSLSSPSPSPEPVDPNVATAIDSGSELSELTDDDADAMSNGQDQDQDNDDQDRPEYDPHDDERAGVRSPDRGLGRKRGRIVPPPMWDWYSTKKPDDKTSIEVEEEEEEEETEGPPKAMEEEEDEEDDDNAQGDHDVDDSMQPATSMGDPIGAPASKGDLYDRGDVPGRRHKRARPRNAFYNDDVTDDDAQTRSKLPRRRSFAKQRPTELKDGEVSSDGEGNDTPSEDEKEREVNDAAQNLISISKTRSRSNTTSKPSIYNKTTHDIPLSPVKSVPSASIMGGASLLRTISRSLSPASLASGSPATSRSASPLGDEDEAEQQEDDTITPGAAAELASALKGASPSLPAGLDAVASSSLPGDDDLELDADHEGPDDQEQEQDLEMEMELESDLQPAHRAEALDVLAAIELKFALLRERVYVEKMEALAWEEALVAEGIHPEMLYLQAELLKRRDKRLELAARKREREILNIVARRKVDEDATWSWWKFARDELQMDMIAETNRKRRRLERERRALEKPQPFRRIPHPPREVPHPPTLRQIIKSFPFGPSHRRHERERDKDISSWVYPDLPPLAPTEVVSDLEYMFQHRRNAFDPHRGPSANPPMGIGVGLGMGMGMPMPMAAAPVGLGPPMPPNGYEASYGVDAASMGVNLPMGMGMNATPTFGPISNGRTGMPPPPPPPPAPYQHQHQPQPHAIPLPPHNFPTRSHPPPLQPPPPTHHSHAAFGIEPDLGGPAAPAPLGQHTYFGSVGATGYVGGRRSISPVLVNGPGKQGGAWPSAKGGGNEWRGEHSHLGELDEDGRERRESRREHDWERERERDKRLERDARARELHDLERERDRERSFHLHMQPQSQAPPHRVPPPPSHQHVHGPPVTHHHPPSHHHHHHHHHVVHHHHPQPVGGGSHSLPLTGPGPVPGRDFETVRASRIEPHPTEIINLSLAKAPGASSSAALPSPWKAEDSPPQPSAEYRAKHRASTSSQDDRDRERPLAMPFVMPATSHGRPSQVNGQQQPAGQSSLPIWMNGAAEESSAFRPASSGYLDSHDGHVYAPVRPHQQGHSRHGSLGLSPPRARASGPDAPSPGYPGPLRSPSRYSGHPNSPTLKMHPIRAVSPPPSGKLGPGSYSSPRLTGPGRTATPLGVDMNGAGTGMHLSSQLPSPRLSLARVGQPESTSKALSPLGPPKLNVPQVVEGS